MSSVTAAKLAEAASPGLPSNLEQVDFPVEPMLVELEQPSGLSPEGQMIRNYAAMGGLIISKDSLLTFLPPNHTLATRLLAGSSIERIV